MAIKTTFNFNSTRELLDAINKDRSRVEAITPNAKSWCGETFTQSMQYLEGGNTSMVQEAERILEKLTADISLSRTDWRNDIAGVIPDVPAFLAGMPENMRARIIQPVNNAPIRVFVNLGSSAKYSAKELLQRGIIILALIMQIQKFRMVELILYDAARGSNRIHDHVNFVRLQTNPIQLSELAYCITSTGFARTLFYGLAIVQGASSSWPDEKNERILCSAHPDDLVIGPWNGYNPQITEIMADPIKWINGHVQKFTQAQEE